MCMGFSFPGFSRTSLWFQDCHFDWTLILWGRACTYVQAACLFYGCLCMFAYNKYLQNPADIEYTEKPWQRHMTTVLTFIYRWQRELWMQTCWRWWYTHIFPRVFLTSVGIYWRLITWIYLQMQKELNLIRQSTCFQLRSYAQSHHKHPVHHVPFRQTN